MVTELTAGRVTCPVTMIRSLSLGGALPPLKTGDERSINTAAAGSVVSTRTASETSGSKAATLLVVSFRWSQPSCTHTSERERERGRGRDAPADEANARRVSDLGGRKGPEQA